MSKGFQSKLAECEALTSQIASAEVEKNWTLTEKITKLENQVSAQETTIKEQTEMMKSQALEFEQVAQKLLADKNADVLRPTPKHDRQLDYVDSKGMRVVVGRYVGADLSSNKPELSEAEINDNRYDPRPGDGDDGQPVFLGAREDRVGKKLWHINKFNIMGNTLRGKTYLVS